MKKNESIACILVLAILLMLILPGGITVAGDNPDTGIINPSKLVYPANRIVADASMNETAAWSLLVMHTNDTHSHLANIARRATVIKKLRGSAPNSLLLDAGDFTTGDLYFNQYEGTADINMLNRLGYDAVTTGNHEYDKGPARLAELLSWARFPVLNANFDYSAEPALRNTASVVIGEQGRDELNGKIFPAVILNVNGEKVGILGLTTEDTREGSSPGPNIKENSFLTAADTTVKLLTHKGINKIIAITHLGWDEDKKLAEKVEGIDLIVGGHTHTVPSDYPTVVDPDNTPTLVVQAGSNAVKLGQISIKFDNNGVVLPAQSSGSLLTIDVQDENKNYEYAEDATVKAALEEYNKPLEILRTSIVGETSGYLDGVRESVRTRETNLGNIIADSLLEKSVSYQTKAAIVNGGGIRDAINSGDITMGQVLTVLPFGNTMAVVEITGQQLIEALENGVSQVEAMGGRFPQVAGLSFSYDPSRPINSRILKVSIKGAVGYESVNPQALYKVATIEYMAAGGDGYSIFKKASNIYYPGFVDYDVLKDYLARHKPVTPRIEGRITTSCNDGFGTIWQEWSPQTGIEQDKLWTIHFNKEYDAGSISRSSIYVTDNALNNLYLAVTPQADGKTVVLERPPACYQKGQTYTLWIKGVKSLQGTVLQQPVKSSFTIIK